MEAAAPVGVGASKAHCHTLEVGSARGELGTHDEACDGDGTEGEAHAGNTDAEPAGVARSGEGRRSGAGDDGAGERRGDGDDVSLCSGAAYAGPLAAHAARPGDAGRGGSR